MTHRGAGDRWLAGHPVEGVSFAHHATVEVTAGPHAGRRGRVALLIALTPEPAYVVMLQPGGETVRVRQGALAAAPGA